MFLCNLILSLFGIVYKPKKIIPLPKKFYKYRGECICINIMSLPFQCFSLGVGNGSSERFGTGAHKRHNGEACTSIQYKCWRSYRRNSVGRNNAVFAQCSSVILERWRYRLKHRPHGYTVHAREHLIRHANKFHEQYDRISAAISHKRLLEFGSIDRKSTRLNSSHQIISYAVFCLKKKKNISKKNNT